MPLLYWILGTCVSVLLLKLWWPPAKIDPKGKSVLVTGAASGIGRATAEVLLRKGCFVFAADVNEKALKEAFGDNANVKTLVMNVTKQEDVDTAAKNAQAAGRGLFAIVNSAGVASPPGIKDIIVRTAAEMPVETHVRPVYEVNCLGLFRVNTAFLPLLMDSSKDPAQVPSIINIASVAGVVAAPGMSVYAGTKFAVVAYSDSLRRETRGQLRVTTVLPGFVDTPLVTMFADESSFKLSESTTRFYDNLKRSMAKRNLLIQPGRMMHSGLIADHIVRAIFSSPAPAHILIDKPVNKLVWHLASVIPAWATDWLLSF